MKTPQENPAETAEAVAAKILADKCPHQPRGQVITCLDCITAMQKRYADIRVAAAREEGRREGIEQAANAARPPCICDRATPDENGCRAHRETKAEKRIRALTSQPKPGRGIRIELTEEQRAALTVPAGAIPKPAVTCDGCKRGLRLQCGIVPPRHFDVDGLGEYVYTPCTAKLE